MDYATLCSRVQEFVVSTFTADQLALFAKQTEQAVYNTVLFPSLRKVATLSTTGANPLLNAPSDLNAVHSMAVVTDNVHTFLLDKDVSYLREAYPNAATTGVPKFYALYGPQAYSGATQSELTFILAPTPAGVQTIELHYFYYPESIVTAGNTWLSNTYDNVLLYGMVQQAYIFLKGDADLMAVYGGKFKEELDQARILGNGWLRSDTYRVMQTRVGV